MPGGHVRLLLNGRSLDLLVNFPPQQAPCLFFQNATFANNPSSVMRYRSCPFPHHGAPVSRQAGWNSP